MNINDVINNVEVFGLERAIKESKYPMITDVTKATNEVTKGVISRGHAESGSGHDNFLKGITVAFDLTLTTKAWVEAERYHFLEFSSSQSTMHRITKFDLDKAYVEYVSPDIIQMMKDLIESYNTVDNWWGNDNVRIVKDFYTFKSETISKEDWKKRQYLRILYSNPCGFKLTAGMRTNYQQLKTIYFQRKDHRLPEWRIICKWIETLPMFKELILNEQ